MLHVDDACAALLTAAGRPAMYGQACFATHDEHLTVAEIAAAIVRVFGRGKITHVEWPEERKRIEIEKVRFSAQRFRELTGWTPAIGFEEGLTRTRQTMQQQ